MLAVSARRHGLLLAFWLNAILYGFFDVSFGADVATGTPFGAAELPGSAAVASLHDADGAAVDWGDFAGLTVSAAYALSAPTDSTARMTPAYGTSFLTLTEPSEVGSHDRPSGNAAQGQGQDFETRSH